MIAMNIHLFGSRRSDLGVTYQPKSCKPETTPKEGQQSKLVCRNDHCELELPDESLHVFERDHEADDCASRGVDSNTHEQIAK